MAFSMPHDFSQKEMTGVEIEASQLLTQKWYFSRKEIELHTPSRSDGIDYKQEQQLRRLYCSFLQELGIELKVPQVTIATSVMFCHRFYMRQSHAKNDWQTIATASMLLASKAEETPRWLGELVVVAYKLIYKGDRSAPRRIREIYDKQKELILTAERLLLYVLAFDLNIEHPYKSLVAALKRLDINHKELVKVAWNFVNDWLRTSLCLQYKPPYIAAGSLFLASKIMKVNLPTSKGKAWWMEFDVSPKQLEDVIQQMTRLWERSQSQNQALAPKDQKVTQLQARKTNAQASDSGSGSSVIEDTNITEPVTVKSDLSSTCMTVSAGGIIGNSVVVDVNKIREKMKQRRLVTTTKGKRGEEGVADEMDGEDWIERELENGIVLQSAHPDK